MQMIKSICYGFPLIYMMWKIKSLRTTYSGRTNDSKINIHVRTLPIKYLGRLIVYIDSLFINLKNGVGIIVIARKGKNQFPVLK